ncbi:hypothetical protein E3N88_32335 [Mikania micrantha]|uniref:Uncharacterized protein n=1 Tax=Mikania micrantha TaxID=192012 RepID=A0A5N6M8R4_9ASTR|nr:hypothetical protein E3N88_32335 [Mikania micrantha]
MKKDVAECGNRCLMCARVNAEHQKPSGLLEQPEIPLWKWEQIAMDFNTKLPRTSSGHDTTMKPLGMYLNQSTARHPPTDGPS